MIQGLLLAAGKSKRFGSQKLLAHLPNKQVIAIASAISLRNATDGMLAVVDPKDKALIDRLREAKTSIVPCSQSKFGLGHSIACGVAETNDALGWVIALADMPFIKSSTIESVVSILKKGALIAVPVCDGRRGHPVGFSQRLYSELLQLKGDVGARTLLNRHQSEVVEIECHDRGIFIDVDTPEDLQRYSKEYSALDT